MMKWLKVSIVFLSALAMVACGPIHTKPVHTYALSELKKTAQPRNTKSRSTLLVSNPTAAPGYQTEAMIYMMTPYELKSYADNRWVAPPAQMILPLLLSALRAQGYFYAVVSPPFSGITNLRLDTQLVKMQQEFLLPTSRVRMVIQAQLINNTTNRIVASRRFETVVSAPENNPYSGVRSANKAVAVLSQKIARFCVRSAR